MNFIIEKAARGDTEGILEVMRPWNMHHVPSAEMPELDMSCFFVARKDNIIIGAAGYAILSDTRGKTTLLGVLPEFSGQGIGRLLQDARLEEMYRQGVQTVVTNADRPDTILWYKKYYGYREVGKLKKICEFSLPEVHSWTTLEMDLDDFMKSLPERQQHRASYISKNDPYPLSSYSPLMINACLTGMVPTKISNPHVSVHPDEIILDAVKVFDAGARLVHLHARDEQGRPTPDARIYEKIISGLKKERPGIICCVTTSGRNWNDFERRSEVLFLNGDAKPDMASLTLGSLNFFSAPSVNSIETIERLAMTMLERNIKPELEIFDTGRINLAKYLERNGLIQGKKYFNLLFGNINTAPATIGNLSHMVQSLPENSVWAAAGLGQFQLPMNIGAVIAGGHVRVGVED
ncbi:MAG TPA: GNAT family N-acetyltransferase, partial [Prosthecochloris aestuarii]|nr:GNAT family N-acetyltransferase [Prosthecochloris aestuarii]